MRKKLSFLIILLIFILSACGLSKQKTKLEAPTISIEEDTLYLSTQKERVDYMIFVDDTLYKKISTTSMSLKELSVGTHTISAMAYKDDFINSDYSNILEYTVAPIKLDTPKISISDGIISIGKVQKATAYKIFVDDKEITEISKTSYKLELDSIGNYKIKVQAVSTNSSYAASDYSNELDYTVEPKKLDAPKIKLNGNIVNFDNVDNASSYLVYIDDEEPVSITTNHYVISKAESKTYKIKVKAVPSDLELFKISDYSNTLTYNLFITTLQAPFIVLEDDLITYKRISNATAYKIIIDDEEVDITSDTSYQLKINKVGTYKIKVQATSNNAMYKDSSSSNEVEYVINPIKLEAPNLTIDENVLSWDSIDNASSYEIFIENKSIIVDTFTYTITKEKAGTYQIKIKALSNRADYIDSDYSNEVTYNVKPLKLETPEIILNDNIILWDEVEHATSYKVYIDEEAPLEVTDTSFALLKDLVGSYKIKVKAFSSDSNYVESFYSNEIDYVVVPTKLAAPSISLIDNIVLFNQVQDAMSYKIYINDDDPIEVDNLLFVINKSEVGTYKIKIKASSDYSQFTDSDYSNEVEYVVYPSKLDKPAISIADNVVTISAVTNATAYKIYIDDKEILLDSLTYTITESVAKTYKIKVKAVEINNKYADSDYSNEVLYVVEQKKLSTPILSIDGNVISWSIVEHATSYKIYIDEEAPLEVTETSFELLKDLVGNYIIKIKAFTNDINYDESYFSNEINYQVLPTELPIPTISINNNVLIIDEVEHATSYEININDEIIEITSTNYELTEELVGTYRIKVKALSNAIQYLSSDYSNELSYIIYPTILDAPIISLNVNEITFDNIEHATSYEVYIDDEEPIEITTTDFTIDKELVGTYKIKVKALTTNNQYAESDFSNEVEFVVVAKILHAPTIIINDNILNWNEITNASSYEIYINEEEPIIVNSTNYVIEKELVGTYRIKVKAISNSLQYENSYYSNILEYVINPTKLTSPEIALNGNTINWEKIDNATAYAIYVDEEKLEINTNSYSLTNLLVGTYKIKVKALTINTQYIESDYSNEVEYVVNPTKLNSPSIVLNGNVISWGSIANATSYEVYIDDEEPIEIITTDFTVEKELVGTYLIKIKANTTNNQYSISDYSNEVKYIVNPTKLNSPSIILNGNVISWEGVLHATSYVVYIDKDEILVDHLSYTITKEIVGTYNIKIKALSGNAQYSTSDYSNEVSYVVEPLKLATATILLDENVISWHEIEHATSYKIYINDDDPIEITETSYEITKDEVGTYLIKVKALTTNTQYTESFYSNEVEYRVVEYLKFENNASALSRVGEYFEILGNVSRATPIVSNGGLSAYPTYLTNMPDTSLNQAITDENLTLIASGTTYDSMDKDGKLYLNGVYTGNDLYKHSASVGLYGGNVSDDEVAVKKKITISSPKPIGNYITGLYAPAGEIIKIEISEKDLANTGGLEVLIGMSTGRNQTNNIDLVKIFNRMPMLQNKMSANSTITYVGSYFGGPIYISSKRSTSFSVTISGAVEYLHYIDGLTSEAEFNRLLKTSAPYLDMEVYDHSVRFSGPRYAIYGNNSSVGYENAVKVMTMWQNFNMTSRSVPHGMNTNAFITMLFDTYIKANASALAFVGADYATLPVSWMSGSLNYETFMLLGGWGSIHEFNHHFQKFGCNGNNNEVSNNVMNFIEYILYTRITEYRNYSSISHGISLDSHDDINYLNKYRNGDPSTGNIIELRTEQGYAILVENFGPELMLEVFRAQNGVTTIDAFYQALTDVIKMDFEFFFTELWHLTVSESVINSCKANNYPTYVPVGTFYSSSFSFEDINNESNHALPYICNKEFVMDLGADIITVDGYNVEILEVSNPKYGKLTNLSGNIYKYEASSDEIDSFTVRVRVYNSSFNEYVTITFDLNPINQGVEVTTYKYNETPYSTIEAAYEANFAGYSTVSTKYQTGQNVTGVQLNTIVTASGKFLIEESGTYLICYKGGRGSSMLYASLNDEEHYEKIGYITINQSGYMIAYPSYAYKTMVLEKGDVIYYKEYILPTSANASLEIGFTKVENPTASDIKKVPDYLFRGVAGDFDNDNKNYDLRNNNITAGDFEIKNVVDYSTLTATSPNFIPWENQSAYSLDKIFDGDDNTYAHSQRNVTISESNPIDLFVTCTQMMSFNKISIYGTASQVPISFDLYALIDGEYVLLGNYRSLPVSNRSVSITFDEGVKTTELKFHITRSSTQYFAISKLDIYEYYGFNSIKLSDASYYGNVEISYEPSAYGHTYKLNNDSYLEYEFNDSICLGLLISSNNYKIYIDGKLVELSDVLCETYSYDIYEFKLTGNHKIKILVNEGYIKLFDILKVKI